MIFGGRPFFVLGNSFGDDLAFFVDGRSLFKHVEDYESDVDLEGLGKVDLKLDVGISVDDHFGVVDSVLVGRHVPTDEERSVHEVFWREVGSGSGFVGLERRVVVPDELDDIFVFEVEGYGRDGVLDAVFGKPDGRCVEVVESEGVFRILSVERGGFHHGNDDALGHVTVRDVVLDDVRFTDRDGLYDEAGIVHDVRDPRRHFSFNGEGHVRFERDLPDVKHGLLDFELYVRRVVGHDVVLWILLTRDADVDVEFGDDCFFELHER